MKTNLLFPLSALGLLAIATLPFAPPDPGVASANPPIFDFPTITVNPSAQDAAHFRAHRIVDLPRITVRPEPADLALWLAAYAGRDSHAAVALPEGSTWDGQPASLASDALAAR